MRQDLIPVCGDGTVIAANVAAIAWSRAEIGARVVVGKLSVTGVATDWDTVKAAALCWTVDDKTSFPAWPFAIIVLK